MQPDVAEPALGDGPLRWLDGPDGVLAFERPGRPGVTCVVNLSGRPVPLPPNAGVLVSSAPLDGASSGAGGLLPVDAAAWLRTP